MLLVPSVDTGASGKISSVMLSCCNVRCKCLSLLACVFLVRLWILLDQLCVKSDVPYCSHSVSSVFCTFSCTPCSSVFLCHHYVKTLAHDKAFHAVNATVWNFQNQFSLFDTYIHIIIWYNNNQQRCQFKFISFNSIAKNIIGQ